MARLKHSRPAANRVREKLGTALSEKLKREGGIKEAARRLTLNYAILRQDLSKNKFADDDIPRLCRIAGLPPDLTELALSYEWGAKAAPRGAGRAERRFEQKSASGGQSLQDVFELMRLEMHRIRTFVGEADRIIPKLFGSLANHDLLTIFISDNEPDHWPSGQASMQLHRPAVEALRRGALIAYLHPSESLVRNAQGHFSALLTPEDVRNRYERFKGLVRSTCSEKEELDELVGRTLLIEHDNPHLLTPRHRFVLYVHRPFEGNDQVGIWATGTYPVDYAKERGESSAKYLVLPLRDEFTNFLFGVLSAALVRLFDDDTIDKKKKEQVRSFIERIR